MHKAHKTARAIAALLDLAAIGIKDAITKIDLRIASLLNQQNLVATDAEMPITKMAQLRRRQRNRLANAIEDNKVITQTVHF